MKAAISSFRSDLAVGHQAHGHLHLVLALVLALMATLSTHAATIKLSAEPSTNVINATDYFFMDQTNAAAGTNGAYTLRKALASDLAKWIGTNGYSFLFAGSLLLSNQAYVVELPWAAPTNLISGSNAYYYYTNLIYPGLSITSIVAGVYSPGSFQLRLFQNSGSNANMTLPTGTKTPDGSLSVVCTNGTTTVFQIWQGDLNIVRHETDY